MEKESIRAMMELKKEIDFLKECRLQDLHRIRAAKDILDTLIYRCDHTGAVEEAKRARFWLGQISDYCVYQEAGAADQA